MLSVKIELAGVAMIASKEPETGRAKTGAEFLPLDFAGLTTQAAKARLTEEGYNE